MFIQVADYNYDKESVIQLQSAVGTSNRVTLLRVSRMIGRYLGKGEE